MQAGCGCDSLHAGIGEHHDILCYVPLINVVFVSRDDYSEERLPMHPCFHLVANSEQALTTYTSRRLLTLEKVKDPQVQ
jgi:tRNA (guanine10-N2)-methyltransferase